MGDDAVADLRAWQREQDQALRTARRAQSTIVGLDEKHAKARVAFGEAVDALEATGLTREQCATFLGLTGPELVRLGAVKRRQPVRDGAAPSASPAAGQ